MSKNNSIVIWRIFFAYVIMAYHFFNAYGMGSSLYLATDFFFIVSGWLLARDVQKNKYENAWEMLVKKVKKYYPHYIFSLIVGYIVLKVFYVDFGMNYKMIMPEITMTQMAGLNINKMVNVPTWYISVLLICSYFIYYLLQNHKRFYLQFGVPLILIVIGTWFFRNCGYLSHSSLGDVTTGIYWNQPLMLGLMVMSIGVLLYELQNKRMFAWGGRTLEAILFVGCMIGAVFYRKTAYDFLAIIIIVIGVAHAFSDGECKLAQNKVVQYFSRLSYPLYLNHNMFRLIYPQYIDKFTILCFISYIVIVTLYSMFTMFLVDTILHIYAQRKEKKKWEKQLQQ